MHLLSSGMGLSFLVQHLYILNDLSISVMIRHIKKDWMIFFGCCLYCLFKSLTCWVCDACFFAIGFGYLFRLPMFSPNCSHTWLIAMVLLLIL